MSFRDLDVDLESQRPFSDHPEFDKITDEISNLLLDVNNNLVTLKKFVSSLETSKNDKNRSNLNHKSVKSIDTITDLFKNLSLLSRRVNDYEELNPSQTFTKDKVTREIKISLEEFQDLQAKFTTITKRLNEEAKAALDQDSTTAGGEVGGGTIGNPQQELIIERDVINTEEFDHQQNLIREREEEIENIEHGINELNEIFTDLGAIVREQGTMVDNIESNIYDISNSTRSAAGELSKALHYQRRSRGKTFCLLVILVIILVVVILGIFLG
ncbi:Syntaxin-12 [Wickerhamomyces ciferrii]|uniref:Syntaxin-12 n=1 Tax=Wickerhamomyces ciferrii (strain ATCC 14091 / BCRC 22168 / CBS 111 / JCM 3599 / NBRC 0793 / NRRL Y-1031 F-60-10) TaxID=1206466 RepID=K0KR82_WICCF|nr:Syntaxin-12 [Wickerhamomyces ciferrii]CCH43808.1 Syntaxin-12 [Wickerhamomyces ciferrii]